jgi:hypothetical protein
MLLMILSRHRIHYGDRGDLYDGIDIVTGLQDVDGSAYTQQDRTDRFGLA